ncbi:MULTISPECIES: ParB/RepB/Spo0J family partition protein [unclassified Neptuniibacter]|jgi:ParB family chromosome partitioning protein|uniref:ParB/RepB/Spo0J family partition protein n=1 Tax=unclassified Neptuniibacter TaxID=2630693 RepID=UPI000C4CAFBC|nr:MULTISPECIES: ParB/RepB/Spo0J family partition protein [unclassified Neptuniibacter]MAY43087.1 chromosome partitioning protein ParB [Oceanospirillaceae bacterium]|tara:strand:+ start:17844 stop:18722 length:879 start_codon:yes stop_codon:yes gene_type:complete
MAKKRGLGKGLDALLSSVNDVEEKVSTPEAEAIDGYRLLPVDVIQRGRYQPRRDIEPQALEELANSIKAQGVMQPIVVRPIDSDRYEIIAGERRWRATQMAELFEIPAIVKDVPDEAAIAMALIENIQRENLNPIEEAISLQRLQEEFELTQQEVADAVGKSRSAVTNLLRLMNLTDEVKKMLEYGDLEMGHARALLSLESEKQIMAAHEISGQGLSVRQTEALVKKLQQENEPAVEKKKPVENVRLNELAGELSIRFATNVAISENAKGKGKITINYDDAETLDSILEVLK